MKYRKSLIMAAIMSAIISVPSAHAQTNASQVKMAEVMLAGAPVRLRMAETITTKGKMLWEGRRFKLIVQEPVTANGAVVIPQGSIAVGEVTQIRNKGSWGRSGYVGIRLVSVHNGERTIRLSGRSADKGIIGTGGVIAALATIPVLGFAFTGTSGTIKEGTLVTGYTDEDVPVTGNVMTKASAELPDALYGRNYPDPVYRSVPAVMDVDN